MKSRRILAVMATLLMGTTAFSGCGMGGTKVENSGYDATKANLTVATFDGGVGRAWLEEAAERFEAKYAYATHFETGKTGVKVSVDGDKNKYAGNKLSEGNSLNKDVYFTEAVDYYAFVNKQLVADITDVVTGPMTDYGESRTIEDKIDGAIKSFMTAKDQKYYMIPFYDGFYGFTYDIDLFEERGFYFDDDGDFISIKDFAGRDEFEAAKSDGPDGVPSYDDGLPATYEQMIELCDRILAKNAIPFCYSGSYPGYVNRSFFGYAADYEGYDAFMLNNTFSGNEVEVVKSITNDGSLMGKVETETISVTKDNGYDVQRQAGKYYALKMQELLFGSTKYVGGAWNGLDYTVAQSTFIKSKYTATPYAMLAEGVWWENEASPTFFEMETLKQEKKSDRRFGFMSVPKANADRAGAQTMFSVNKSFGFINKNAANMELAKEFMRFLHTDAEMSKFSAKTSIPRSLDYQVAPADKATATPYGQYLIQMRSESKVVYSYSALDFVINHASNFDNDPWYGVTTVGAKNLNNPFNAFKGGTANAKNYFEGLYTYQKNNWSTNSK